MAQSTRSADRAPPPAAEPRPDDAVKDSPAEDDERIHGDEAIEYARWAMTLKPNKKLNIADKTPHGPLRGKKNYHDWSTNMLLLLRCRCLERFIFGGCERPPGQYGDGGNWDRLRSCTALLLINNISPSIYKFLFDIESPKAIWETLKQIYAPQDSLFQDVLHNGLNVPNDSMRVRGEINAGYLNAKLNETVYMECPHEFEEEADGKACLLQQSIYGLKQAAVNWFDTLGDHLISKGSNVLMQTNVCRGDGCVHLRVLDDINPIKR